MEEIYLKGFTSRREWCTDPVDIKPYFQKMNNLLSSCGFSDKKGKLGELDILQNLVPKTKDLSDEQLGELFASIKIQESYNTTKANCREWLSADMEEIYLKGFTSRREWCTDPVDIKPYFQKMNNLLSSCGFSDKKGKLGELDILQNLVPKTKDLSDEQLGELFASINPADLTICDAESIKLEADEKPQPSTSKNELQLLKEVCGNGRSNKSNRIKMERNKFNRKEIILNTAERCGLKDLHPRNNILVNFRIHEPFMHDKGSAFSSRPGQCSHEIAVLGHQTLSDLRDKIICEMDYQDILGDSSNSPDVPVKERAREVYLSGMFYFANTFYIDTRYGGNEDYSKPIREWGQRRGLMFGETKPMQDTAVQDLQLRFGYSYLYMHQGCCEHIIIVSDARMLHETDSLYTKDYPLMNKISQPQMMNCMLCVNKAARWIVGDCDRLLHNPTYECKSCFKKMHYIKGKKVGHFKAYHFWQRSTLM